LACDGIPLAAIAQAEGTPLYVYSANQIRERYRALDDAFGGYPHSVHYALKANSLLAVARLLRSVGSAADANSIWEIEVARKAGFTADQIVFTGVGKSQSELECAVPLGLKAINVESAGELARIEAIARIDKPARVAVRINPDIDPKSHPHISTGLRFNKFGVGPDEAAQLFESLGRRPRLRLVAVHAHVGSQITTIEPLRRAAAFLSSVALSLMDTPIQLEYLDVGGGLGISYDGTGVVSPHAYVQAMLHEVRSTGLPIVIEPGRSITGPAGVLVARVVDVKPRDGASDFAVLDAGMSELMRPALYGAFHRIEPVVARDREQRTYEIVGPVCESADVMGRDRVLPVLEVGDLVAIRDAGAYGSVMASNYNRRPFAAEVLVDEGAWRVIRRRQPLEHLLGLES
jgi:diaminopimelate decarboxylase